MRLASSNLWAASSSSVVLVASFIDVVARRKGRSKKLLQALKNEKMKSTTSKQQRMELNGIIQRVATGSPGPTNGVLPATQSPTLPTDSNYEEAAQDLFDTYIGSDDEN